MKYFPQPEQVIANVETGRAVVEVPFGIACYECLCDQWWHKGLVGTVDEAQAWLRGEHPAALKRVYE